MKTNLGSTDRLVRIIIGFGSLAAGFCENWLGLIGVVPILTNFTGVCPAYPPFGLNTPSTKIARKS
ncbi:MAG: hypothetical protein RIQ93_1454 [Verrucomicrobiota bacterium]